MRSCPGGDQEVLLLLGNHHLRVGVIGIVYRKRQNAQQADHQSRNQHFHGFSPFESRHTLPSSQNIIPRWREEKNSFFIVMQAGPEFPGSACTEYSFDITVSDRSALFRRGSLGRGIVCGGQNRQMEFGNRAYDLAGSHLSPNFSGSLEGRSPWRTLVAARSLPPTGP